MPVMPGPKKAKKKIQIIETAEDLFTKHGMKRITVEEICQKAGVSKMTFYKYFSNKVELAKYIWRMWLEEGIKEVDRIDEMNVPFPEKLEMILKYKLEFASNWNPDFLAELLSLDIPLEEGINYIIQFLIEAQKRGDIRPDIRPEFFMAAYDKLFELAKDENLRRLYPDMSDFTRELFNFYFHGVLTKRGPEN
ncbi:MAG: TetR/AcrR family transcriptional regulator [Deltaproteobacteria bacterium]|nr:TetR/AcrR family transcriptional regulator [Deltaproteobacteria bacterium]